MWFATTADGLGLADGEGSGVKTGFPLKYFLLNIFKDWHNPIGDLLRATREEDIIREDARAMSRHGLRLAASASSRASTSRLSGALLTESSPPGATMWDVHVGGDGGAVIVGDAAHTVSTLFGFKHWMTGWPINWRIMVRE